MFVFRHKLFVTCDSLFIFCPPTSTHFPRPFLSIRTAALLRLSTMAVTHVLSRPGSPESATLDVLQDYDGPSTQSASSRTTDSIQPDTEEDTSPVGSTFRLDLRAAAVSCCSESTTNLIPQHSHGEYRESPFRWNYPSLPDLAVHQPETDPKDVVTKGKKRAMRIWEGWKVILFCSCKIYVSRGSFYSGGLWYLLSVGIGLNVLLLLMPVSVRQFAVREGVRLIEYSGFLVLLWKQIRSWCLFVSNILRHENASTLRFTVCILSMIPLVKVFL